MNDTATTGILVGVTGKGENTAALRWAVRESRARQVPVTLVHVVQPVLVAPPTGYLVTYPDLTEIGAGLLAAAAEEYDDLRGPDAMPCRSVLHRGHVPSLLSDLSAEAALVVLAHRRLSQVRRLVTGSISVAVAAHAHCPVVSVPVGDPEDATAPPTTEPSAVAHRWVTVGVHESGAPEAVLRDAFETAAVHGWGVRLLHAWRLDPEYDDVVFRRVGSDWEEQVVEELRAAVEPLGGKYPDVPVSVTVRHDWPADALVHASRSSELLVVGRHGKRPLLPQRIGSVARTLLRTAECPVMVVAV